MVEEKENLIEIEENEMFNPDFEADRFHTVEIGEIISAKVILVKDDEAYVDIGGKSDMVIPLKELTDQPVASAKEVVKSGDVIKVMVVKAGGDDGVQLSKRRIDQEKGWEDLAVAYEKKSILTGKVIGLVKGGLNLKLSGVNAFMPASQISLSFQANLAEFVDQEVKLQIIEFDRERRRVVVSRRIVLEAEKREAEKSFYQTIAEGKRLTGKVTRTTNFGAFIDLGSGIEGLIHISELSWNRVKSVEEVLKPGQTVDVVITKIDTEQKKIGLSLKQIQAHPWVEAIKNFSEGDVYHGKVTRLEAFGAFVALAPQLEGLVHVSQISDKRISKPDEVLKVGEEVVVKIIKIDYENKKVSLSIKQVSEDQASQENESFLEGQDQGFTQSLEHLFKK